MAYATVADLQAWLSDDLTLPSDALRLLDAASRHVDYLTRVAVYDIDDNNNPTDVNVIDAFKQATCAQAAWWIETGDEQGAASVLNSAGSGGGPYWGGKVQRSAPAAIEILQTSTDSAGTPLFAYAAWMA